MSLDDNSGAFANSLAYKSVPWLLGQFSSLPRTFCGPGEQ